MEKFIIEIHGAIKPEDALLRVAGVIAMGKISESRGRKHHCFLSRQKDGVVIACRPNKNSERFMVWRESVST